MKVLQKNLFIENSTKKYIFIIHLMVTVITCYLVIFGLKKDNLLMVTHIYGFLSLDQPFYPLYSEQIFS